MFRTIILRSDVAKEVVRKSLRSKSIRNVSVEYCKRRHYHRSLFGPESSQVLQKLVKTEHNFVRNYASDLPNHTKVTLPALSPTMELGTIISWEKKEGDKLNEGDLLAEIETDKATMGFETPEEGYLAKILIPAGTKDVPIGKLVCIIVESEADIAAFKDFKDTGAAAPAPPKAAPAPSAPAPSTPTPSAPVPASSATPVPEVPSTGKGTGLFDSITTSDLPGLEAAHPAPAAPGISLPAAAPKGSASPFVDIPVTGMRATIAKRLLQSKQTIPHYYLSVEINIDNLLAIRARYNKKLEKDKVKLSVNDFIIKAVAQASLKVPEANSSWQETTIRQYRNVDVSVAVSTDKGLITPIIFEAERKGVVEISKTMKTLAVKAREGKLQPQEFQGGTISVSNLGMMGIDQFCAVINPPQSCILAIGTSTSRLVADPSSDKGFKTSQFMQVTLSCDHRTVDGAVGARWLQAFKDHLEDPVSMVI
ncbi:dihydrolipoyllysine-residue acetyltransferase component of pyruvate dehydrogenase complex, mitochondrial isoform X3 [Diorhabda sublineata]|uniref:dihydrolipoyllysine-residue acetyltransferase component of pyruvate dehydrogenase complex, mitochondrial isoform X3 n=1 Tax=Diorhabda sublineata TaxID=1163346 RepID=UPI0024E07073|nr:dihydrolipoyllysine-residue acetyltransferase component of pyruvate dehydrogenase complex, mitochondrial isoform X3 [Diorhabda sublineata]